MQSANSNRWNGWVGPALAGLLWVGVFALPAWLLTARASAPPDALAAAMCGLTLFVAAICVTFSLRYMRAEPNPGLYFVKVAGLIASVIAFISTSNLILLGITWCASGVLLARLIGNRESGAEAAAASARALRSFLTGDLALLAGIALLVGWSGSVDIGAALAAAKAQPSTATTIAAGLMLIGAAARCALPPFSGWLLSSMTAVTPVSALMHAGLVNAGGFLLIRFSPLFEAAPSIRISAIVAGLAAVGYGLGIMMVRPDIKRSLAGSTISQMGFMVMSCGLGAYAAALWHILAHGLFKAWLFLGSGSTVGRRPDAESRNLGARASLAISAITLLIAFGLVASDRLQASLIPFLLSGATAAATLFAALRLRLPMGTSLSLLIAIAALLAFNVVGMALATMAVGSDGPVPLSPVALCALLLVFLGGWAVQQARLASGKPLPGWLYVRLINSGALKSYVTGSAK